jgi:glycine cleavage system aminomethyltransferase T
MLKKHGDFIGRSLAQRPALNAPGRLQLVGVRPLEPAHRLRNGLHLMAAEPGQASLGYVTSSTPGVESAGWVGLALLTDGRARIGTRLLACSPVHAERTEVEITSPHMLDPENVRVRA